jgi:radical SAM protein with 4Fe4S-binding SPASM domain
MLRKIIKTGRLKAWSIYKDELRKNHDLTYLFWECTLRCNFFCKHCGSNAKNEVFQDELTITEIKKCFKEIAEDFDAKKIMLAITGGEPLVRKDIFEVMSYASELGFPWGMVTNGFLVDKDIVEKMKKADMRTIVVSIDGLEKNHDDFRGIKGAYKKAINAVNLLAEAKFLDDLQITTTIHRGNIKELEKMYQTFSLLGITSWRVFGVDPIGRAENNKELLLNDQEFKVLLDFIKEKRRQSKKINITFGCEGFLGLNYEGELRDHYFYCNTGINTGSILHNGDIFVCPNVPRRPELTQGNIRKDRFSKVWNEKFEIFRDPKRTSCEECLNCTHWENCLGGSFHLWDFKKNQPKICHLRALKEI